MSSFGEQSLEETEDKLKNGYKVEKDDLLTLILVYQPCIQREEKICLLFQYGFDFDDYVRISGKMMTPVQILHSVIENGSVIKYMSHEHNCSCLNCSVLGGCFRILSLLENEPKKRITLFMLMLHHIDQ